MRISKKHIRFYAVSVATCCIWILTSVADVAPTMDLNEAVGIALKKNFDLEIRKHEENIAKRAVSLAWAPLFPKISVEYRYTLLSDTEYTLSGAEFTEEDEQLVRDFGSWLSKTPSDSISDFGSWLNNIPVDHIQDYANALETLSEESASLDVANFTETTSWMSDMSGRDISQIGDWLQDINGANINELGTQMSSWADMMGATRSISLFPEEAQTVMLSFQQLLFNDKAFTLRRAAKRHFESSELATKTEMLDVVEKVSLSYIRLLSEQAMHRIARDNLKTIVDHLSLAKSRQEQGAEGPESVLRFETREMMLQAELAKARKRDLIARTELCTLLGISLNGEWLTEDLSLEHDDFSKLADILNTVLEDDDAKSRLYSFADRTMRDASPALAALDKLVDAQSYLAHQKSRSFFLPDIGVQGVCAWSVDETFASEYHLEQNDEDPAWAVSVYASFPLMEGGRAWADARQAKENLKKREAVSRRFSAILSARALTSIHKMESSYVAIGYSKKAAVGAEEILRIVADKYENGASSVTDLIEAQNTAFVSRQNVALATYAFIADLIQFQRSMSWFPLLHNEKEIREWNKALEKAVSKNMK